MNLFSKKTLICKNCGKEIETRIALGEPICSECKKRIAGKRKQLAGYEQFHTRMGGLKVENYTEAELDEIAAHRDNVLEKIKQTDGISRAELKTAADNYKKLTDDQATDILSRVANASVMATLGAGYTSKFFVPTGFDGTIVDVEDVFAVGYTGLNNVSGLGDEVILCAIFTNDPYLYTFPMIYWGKLGFFEIFKSKSGRRGVKALFEALCPNLTYPVEELKQLMKEIKATGTVKGNIDFKKIIHEMDNASCGVGIYNYKDLVDSIPEETAKMLDRCGYIHEDEINELMGMNKMFQRAYWKKQIKRISNYDIGD